MAQMYSRIDGLGQRNVAPMPGDAIPVNVGKKQGITASELARSMPKHAGDHVESGKPLVRSKGLFGFFQTELPSPVEGIIESISKVTGQVLFRGAAIAVQVLAYLTDMTRVELGNLTRKEPKIVSNSIEKSLRSDTTFARVMFYGEVRRKAFGLC